MRPIVTTSQIGALLAARRKHLQLSQADVAGRIGISQNRLSVLEKNPSTLTLKQLLAVLNVLGVEMTLAAREK
jgi:HTH-type transcriptional regulator/antitoxin HipB